MNGEATGARRFGALLAVWVALISGLHMAWNVDWGALLNDFEPRERRKLNIAYIPVT